MTSKIMMFAVLMLSLSCVCLAQDAPPRYKLLATTRTSTMQKEIDEMAAQGYRIVVGAPTSDTEMTMFLSMDGTVTEPYKYKLVATDRTGTMEKELNEVAHAGYRLIPSTMIAKKKSISGLSSALGGGDKFEIVMILEQSPKMTKQYEYKFLATNRTSTMQKEVSEAREAGFFVVGMISRGELMVVMERERNVIP